MLNTTPKQTNERTNKMKAVDAKSPVLTEFNERGELKEPIALLSQMT
jgi:hypothetical protein